jgi:uncharacterized Fe-S cluster protein YjdI
MHNPSIDRNATPLSATASRHRVKGRTRCAPEHSPLLPDEPVSAGHQRTYESGAIRVHWDSSRCIHPGIRLRTLPSVFDVCRRPWVDLRDADANAVADAVSRCPTGALRYERLDGAEGERPQRPKWCRPSGTGR